MSRLTPMQRWAAKVQLPADPDGCWEWTGNKNHHGYGGFYVDGKNRRAHRYGYERFVGEVPEGLQTDHLCRNRSCVNPSHLEPVTRRENILRGIGPSAIHAAKLVCLNGHSLEGDAVYRRRDRRGRHCRQCQAERQMAYVATDLGRAAHLQRGRDRYKSEEFRLRDNARRRKNYATRRDALNEVRRASRRASASPCTVCGRTYQDLARHMTTKHPEFADGK